MSWNYRVMAHELEGVTYFQIHEVYYDKSKTPNGYTVDPIRIVGDDLKDLDLTLQLLKECRDKPVLWAGNKFPEEYT